MHKCGKCGSHKPDDAFYRRSNGKIRKPCIACMRAYRPPHEAVTEKPCSMCGAVKEVAEFRTTANTKSGRMSACRVCERAWRPTEIVTPERKHCPTCSETKLSDDFYKDNRRADGLYARCKTCHNLRAAPGQKLYQAANRERVREWNRKAINKFLSVPGRMDTQLARLREYNRLHPEAKAVRQQRRRARQFTAVNDFTKEQWEALKVAYGHRCVYCGKHTRRLTMDHVIPLSKGGEHTARNIVPACGPCNTSKGTKPAPPHQIVLPV